MILCRRNGWFVDLLIVLGVIGGVLVSLGWKINVQQATLEGEVFFFVFFLMADHQHIYLYMVT